MCGTRVCPSEEEKLRWASCSLFFFFSLESLGARVRVSDAERFRARGGADIDADGHAA